VVLAEHRGALEVGVVLTECLTDTTGAETSTVLRTIVLSWIF
jgi:hypothetical protein